jgi:hypothetical protein
MTTISISELRPSYLTEVEDHEVDSIFGGFIGDYLGANGEGGIGVPNPTTGIVFTPIGGNLANVQTALSQAIDYSGWNGFVFEVVHGGSFSFLGYQAAFTTIGDLNGDNNG